MSQRKSAAVVLGITALLAPSLSACGSDDNDEVDNQAVCVDQETQERVSDEECDPEGDRVSGPGGSIFLWYFLGTVAGRGFPGIGQRVPAGGTYTAPSSGSYRRGGVPSAGGNVPRGGFGGGTKGGSSGG